MRNHVHHLLQLPPRLLAVCMCPSQVRKAGRVEPKLGLREESGGDDPFLPGKHVMSTSTAPWRVEGSWRQN